jgi:glucosamine-6-phosphate deaminase
MFSVKDCMNIEILKDKATLARAAAAQAAISIRNAISENGAARIIAATGASQFEFLDALTAMPDIDWKKVEMFHLDEYIGLPLSHPASFRNYLLQRLINKVGITRYHLLDGERDPAVVAREVGAKLASAPINVAFVGIGENGHLAFNDPPANFETEDPYLVVNLDEACRRQQILKAEEIICIVPDARKARAVAACFEGEISPNAPASILRTHPRCTVYLDNDSAALLTSAKPH